MPSDEVLPYDALLLVGFGGPEKPDDVVPFLRNVTAGRDIPDERLAEVGEHYYAFGGRSPINDQNRAFLAAIREDLAGSGIDLPVYWGNRNWAPYLVDEVERMQRDGVRRALCLLTSAYSSYSGCRQYREDLTAARAEVEERLGAAPELDRTRVYFNHPGFVEPNVDAVLAALAELPDDVRREARVVFVTHSVPDSMNDASGPVGRSYVAQHRDVAAEVVDRVREETGHRHPHDLVFCSRSGPPQVPWLEPDVNDHLRALAAEGCPAVVVAPVGFVSDHMEVIYDLDTEAKDTAEEIGLPFVRAATAGVDPRFVAMVRDLLLERVAVERGEEVERRVVGGQPPAWDRCAPTCCANPRSTRTALVGRAQEASRMSDPSHAELLGLATDVAAEAAALVHRMRSEGVDVAGTKTSATDVVTAADHASEELIRSRLLAARPDDGFLGEEGHDSGGSSGVRWIVDPIDGTVNYLYGAPHYAVSIAAESTLAGGGADGGEGRTVVGVVHAPSLGEVYTATLGGGAFRNGVPLPRRSAVPLSGLLVASGFNYVPEVRERQIGYMAALLPQVRDLRRCGSAALDLCGVASGQFDAYVEECTHPWDDAAGGLVAAEAGATFEVHRSVAGNRVAMAAPAATYDDFLALCRACGFVGNN